MAFGSCEPLKLTKNYQIEDIWKLITIKNQLIWPKVHHEELAEWIEYYT